MPRGWTTFRGDGVGSVTRSSGEGDGLPGPGLASAAAAVPADASAPGEELDRAAFGIGLAAPQPARTRHPASATTVMREPTNFSHLSNGPAVLTVSPAVSRSEERR